MGGVNFFSSFGNDAAGQQPLNLAVNHSLKLVPNFRLHATHDSQSHAMTAIDRREPKTKRLPLISLRLSGIASLGRTFCG